MSALYRHKIEGYLDQVCLPVKAKEMHPEIRLEIGAHLDAIIEELLAEGLSEELAVEKAIDRMGDPRIIGVRMHQVHKPQMDWNLLVLAGLLLIIGIVAMLAMKTAVTEVEIRFLENKFFYGAIGLLLLVAIYFWDYRKMRRWSFMLYVATAVSLLLTKRFGLQVDGDTTWIRVGTIVINVTMVSMYTFLLAIAGMMNSTKRTIDSRIPFWKNGIVHIKEILLFLLIPVWLYFTVSHISMVVLYTISVSVLLLFSKRWKTWFMYIGVLMAGGAVMLLNDMRYIYAVRRIFFIFNPESFTDTGYISAASLRAIRSAGLTGQGFGARMDQIPFIYNDMIFTYLVYSLGWVTGIVIALLIAAFLVRVCMMARAVTDSYGKNIIAGLLGLIAAQYMLNMLMTVGLFPIMDITLPLISYGGFSFVLNLALIGFVLSVYRRKNMIPTIIQ